MKVKTAYRPKPEIPENIPAEDKPTTEAIIAAPEAPAVAVDVRPGAEPQAETKAEHAYQKEITQADEAAEALRKQIEALRQSEALLKQQAQHAAQVQQAPPTREQLLDQWRRGGVSDGNLKFLEAHPELIDSWQLTFHAANEATQRGHEPNTDAHREATREIFHRYLAEAEKQQMTANNPTAPQETPAFFKAPPAKPMRPQSVPVSAPVSRTVPDGGPRPEFEQDPRRVTLSVEEREVARASGISEVEYAKNKIKMMQAKARGEIV
jgi:hypothetical protein